MVDAFITSMKSQLKTPTALVAALIVISGSFTAFTAQAQSLAGSTLTEKELTAKLNLDQAAQWESAFQNLKTSPSSIPCLESTSQYLETLAKLPLPKTSKPESYGLSQKEILQTNLDTFLLNDCQSRHWGDDFDCGKDVSETKKQRISECKSNGGSQSTCTNQFYNSVKEYRAAVKLARLKRQSLN